MTFHSSSSIVGILILWLLMMTPSFGSASSLKKSTITRSTFSQLRPYNNFGQIPPLLFELQGGASIVNADHDGLSMSWHETLDTTDGQDAAANHDINELSYRSIGFLNFPMSRNNQSAGITLRCSDNSSHSECRDVTFKLDLEGKGNRVSHLAAAETIGCLCDSIVLDMQNITQRILEMEELDDILYCLALGIVRRIKSVQVPNKETVVPILLIYCDRDENQSRLIQERTQQYLDVALSYAGRDLPEKIKVEVQFQLCTEKLGNEIILTDNLVPHSMFEVTVNNIHTNICNRLSSTDDNYSNPGKWTKTTRNQTPNTAIRKLNKDSDTNSLKFTTQPSSGFKEKVEALIAMLLVDAEEALQEIEARIDESFFDLRNENSLETTVPEFGDDFNSVLNAITESFADLDDESLTDCDRNWANSKST